MTNLKKYFKLIALGVAVISLLGYTYVDWEGTNAELMEFTEASSDTSVPPIKYYNDRSKWPIVGYALNAQTAPHVPPHRRPTPQG